MSNDEIIAALEKFKEFLHVGNIFSDPFRWFGWVIVKGLAYILDGLEKVTDDVLLIKQFFQNAEVVAFVDTIRPFLYILLAFSLLYTGYLLIFQKKFDREGIAINLFIALIVIALLGTGMNKANEFTDEAIEAIGKSQLYGEEEGTLSENILSKNIYDLVEFDANGWSSTELDRPNTIPLSMIGGIAITEKFDSSRSELNMSSAGKDLSKKQLIWVSSQKDLAKFDQSGVEWNNSYYYRYSLNWITLLTTIIIMAFTLFSISYKLARLSFELAFNYILTILMAPADIHDGQKTKKLLQAILNTFLVIILIFLSMKVYMIGTAYLADELNGMAYLIALIAFSVAVVDGPNIVERLFGIDAGLKNGWGVLAGAYAGGKMVAGVGRGIANMGKGDSSDKNKSMAAMAGNKKGEKAPSPNDADGSDGGGNPPNPPNSNSGGNGDKCTKCGQKPCVCPPNDNDGGGSNEGNESSSSSSNNVSSVSQQAEEKSSGQRNRTKAPSPNDLEKMGGASGVQTTSSSQSEETNVTGVQGTGTGSHTQTGGVNAPQSPTAQSNVKGNPQTTSSSQSTETARVTDNATVRTDTDATSIQDNIQGTRTGSHTQTGGVNAPQSPTTAQSNVKGNPQTTSSSQSTETAKVTNNATVRMDTDTTNVVEEVAGNTSTNTTRKGGGTTHSPTNNVNTGNAAETKTVNGSHTTEKSKVTSNSTVTTDTEIDNVIQNVTGSTKTSTTENRGTHHEPTQNQSQERKRPRNYSVDKGNSNIIDRMKNHKKK